MAFHISEEAFASRGASASKIGPRSSPPADLPRNVAPQYPFAGRMRLNLSVVFHEYSLVTYALAFGQRTQATLSWLAGPVTNFRSCIGCTPGDGCPVWQAIRFTSARRTVEPWAQLPPHSSTASHQHCRGE
jgi:hypothetical protein